MLVGVLVRVSVGVLVGVLVRVLVRVSVGVLVRVSVEVLEGVNVYVIFVIVNEPVTADADAHNVPLFIPPVCDAVNVHVPEPTRVIILPALTVHTLGVDEVNVAAKPDVVVVTSFASNGALV